jgi:hypothetical protein
MYCSSCGTAAKPGLSYCNRCGTEVNKKERNAARTSEVPPEYLVWAILGVSVGGIGVILALMALMKQTLNFGNGLIAGFSLLSFLLLVGAESVFIWLLVRQRSLAKEGGDITQLKELTTTELGVARARELPEPAASVTEQTTRTLEQSHKDSPQPG